MKKHNLGTVVRIHFKACNLIAMISVAQETLHADQKDATGYSFPLSPLFLLHSVCVISSNILRERESHSRMNPISLSILQGILRIPCV